MGNVLCPQRPRQSDAFDIAEDVVPPCAVCLGYGILHDRMSCVACGGRGWCFEDTACVAELWETLATRGVIPAEWVGDERRVFDCDPDAATTAACNACGRVDAEHPMAHPPDVGCCLALASDPVGVATAEALAREVAARLVPWGLLDTHQRRVVWRVVASGYLELTRGGYPLAIIENCPARNAYTEAVWVDRRRRPEAYQHGKTTSDAWWLGHVELYANDYPCMGDSRPNPFEPELEILRTGYVLEAITDHAIVLVCPEVEL